jgi:uncharacterized membrane protein
MEKSKLKDRCPACGVAAKMFLPYTDPVSEKRRAILSLDLHPILVHFPQAFSTSLLVLSLAEFFLRGEFREKAADAFLVVTVVLPFTVILAFFAGMLDGKTRFRKVRTPILIRKMVTGGSLFLLSCALAALVLASPSITNQVAVFAAILSAGCFVCTNLLGAWGSSIMNAKFPG